MPDQERVLRELERVEVEAGLRRAALDDLFAMVLDDWQAGRTFGGLKMADLVQTTRELVDELNPEAAEVSERRVRVAGLACDLFVEGSDADRAVLVDRIGGSPDLLWVLDEYLSAVGPTDEATTLRVLAAVSLMAGHVDRRDLLVRLRSLQQQTEGFGVDLSPLVARMWALSASEARDLLATSFS
jgi:hypothetical protein